MVANRGLRDGDYDSSVLTYFIGRVFVDCIPSSGDIVINARNQIYRGYLGGFFTIRKSIWQVLAEVSCAIFAQELLREQFRQSSAILTESKRSAEVDKLTQVQVLASRFHDEWRFGREIKKIGISKHGITIEVEPRVKKTVDGEIDIANTPFGSLPEEWKSENLKAAEFLLKYLYSSKEVLDKITGVSVERTFILDAARAVHEDWIRRRVESGETIADSLSVPFEQLSQEEQQKDIDQVLLAIELIELIRGRLGLNTPKEMGPGINAEQ
ncbi:hypothetical protein D6810_00975 [Candidatus Dojkabacteria bacterium]|uniref:Uncharacterized protein n=1 Tax=Candidatus Dojkabacteria bacterium TaxID=2099670 RepID=A0A3M0YZ29_9BACT|nr:MAG: hypothetical protein D6810_00975 [Candidatus Dojkabacteria bacterium]